MNQFLWMFTGMVIGGVLATVLGGLMNALRRKKEERLRSAAMRTLEGNGLTPRNYIASVDYCDNAELRSALDALSGAGYVITDTKGELVGMLLPRDTKKRPKLRLVSN